VSLIFILFIGFSVTHAVAYLHVFHWLRKLISGVSDKEFYMVITSGEVNFRASFFGRLLRCHACLGFWVGVFLYSFNGNPIVEEMVVHGPIVEAVCSGFLQLGFNSFAWLILMRLGAEEL
jgi:hypothetical protein